MGNIHVVGPNQALVISGGCCGSSSKRYVIGGWTWTCCLVTDIQRISLEVFTLNPKCTRIETIQGVPISVTGVAQCKIDKERIAIACEMFLGRELEHIKQVVLQTIEGHLRAVTGTSTMERIYKERNVFAEMVREMVTMDLQNVGVQLLSFTLKDITDEVEYLASLGRKQIADVKKEAAIGVAAADRECCMKRVEANQKVQEAKFQTETVIETSQKDLRVKQCDYEQILSRKRVESEHSYELKLAELRSQLIKVQIEGQTKAIEKQMEIQKKEALAAEHRLAAELVESAEAEKYRLVEQARGRKEQILAQAKAESARIKKLADAQAKSIRAVGEAEAGRLAARAAAFKSFQEAATLQLTLSAMPKLAAELSAPLCKVQDIVMVSGSAAGLGMAGNFSAETAQLVSELPPTIKALTGLDFGKILASAATANSTNPVSSTETGTQATAPVEMSASANVIGSKEPIKCDALIGNNAFGGLSSGATGTLANGVTFVTPSAHLTPLIGIRSAANPASPLAIEYPTSLLNPHRNEPPGINSSVEAVASEDFRTDRKLYPYSSNDTSISRIAFDGSSEKRSINGDLNSESISSTQSINELEVKMNQIRDSIVKEDSNLDSKTDRLSKSKSAKDDKEKRKSVRKETKIEEKKCGDDKEEDEDQMTMKQVETKDKEKDNNKKDKDKKKKEKKEKDKTDKEAERKESVKKEDDNKKSDDQLSITNKKSKKK